MCYMTRCRAAVIEESSVFRPNRPVPVPGVVWEEEVVLVPVVVLVAAVLVEGAVEVEVRCENRPCFSLMGGEAGLGGSSFLERRPMMMI